MGKTWKGRACWAVMRVARRVGGTEFSVVRLLDVVSWKILCLMRCERLREHVSCLICVVEW